MTPMNRSELFQSLGKTKKGEVAEQIVETELALRDYRTLQPKENERYDLAVEEEGEIHRIQVKTAYRVGGEGSVVFDTSNNNTQRTHENVSKNYTKDEIDYFAVYCSESDEVYIVPVEETGTSSMSLRLEEPENGQTKKINWAVDYRIGSVNLENHD